ncbi:endonuclease/exonuclease/phosphatase family protein [Streptomyces alkaliterrae]|nr:endonuclease/exonuclease/phosphatase family protein [Streptomyces alkaliterrae]
MGRYRRPGRRLASLLAAAGLLLAVAAPAGAAPSEGRAEPTRLRVMSLNLWHGGAQVDDGLAKQVAVIRKHRPDVVGLQETSGHAARDLAAELGWHHYQSGGSIGVISRFPITGHVGSTSAAAGVRLELGGGRKLELWSAHLGYHPYGPYDACFDRMDVDRIFEREERSGRVPQARELAERLAGAVERADDVPVLLVGDFNSPSHLDWTAATRDRHCGYGPVDWPTTRILANAGFRDSFREVHPDPARVPGETWSPVYPFHNGSTGRAEPQDRIDYVTYAGAALTPLRSAAVVDGRPRPVPDHRGNRWPTDHAAVLTDFALGG